MPLSIGWSGGVILKTEQATFHFDSKSKNNEANFKFISHSHGDHLSGLNALTNNYITPETQDILFYRYNLSRSRFSTIPYKKRIRFDTLEVTAHNAGHILGSAQYEIVTPNITCVYTGDINCKNMLTTTSADAIQCDILIMESTYGHPNYVFPSFGETCSNMVTWALNCVNKEVIPVFQVYSTGKAQEVNKIFNTFTRLPVVVTPSIAKVNKAYEKNNIALSYCCSNTDEGQALLNKKHCVFLTSKYKNNSLPNKFLTAAATGWAYTSWTNKYAAAFPLSGHADFKQLVNYVKNVNPKKVLTLHGFKDELASYLTRKVGIKAQPITASTQKHLFEYV